MTDQNQESGLKHPLPRAALDSARCANGILSLAGWAVFSVSDFEPAEVVLRSVVLGEEARDCAIPVTPVERQDVLDFIGIGKAIKPGFSTQLSLDKLSIEDLPYGEAEVIVRSPASGHQPITIGRVLMDWPDQDFTIERDSQPIAVDLAPAKQSSFFKKLWLGELGANPHLRSLVEGAELNAQALINGIQLIKKRPSLRPLFMNYDVLKTAVALHDAAAAGGLMTIFDHNFGGGANTFSKKIAGTHLSNNNAVLRIWFNPTNNTFEGSFSGGEVSETFPIGGMRQLFELCISVHSAVVIVNSLWTYPQLNRVLDNILRLKVMGFAGALQFYAHDHMGVCPSLFLLNDEEQYCGVPKDLSVCESCLLKSKLDFKVFFPDTDIAAWRRSWESLFTNCDLIRFFSNSTRNHYERAFPSMVDNGAVVVEGHSVADIWDRQYDREKALEVRKGKGGMRIGVFGFIGRHKGSEVVWKLVQDLAARRDGSQIKVFGSLDGKTYGRHGPIEILGPYRPRDMVDLCEQHGIDFVLMPSICPETFSLLVKEAIMIGVPIVSFDLGAQGDFVGDYEHGFLLDRNSNISLVENLVSINQQISADHVNKKSSEAAL